MRKLGLGFVIGVSTLLACAGLKVADDAPPGDDAGNDAGGDDATVRDGNLDPPDAGPPPSDFECTKSDAWTASPKVTKECEARTVTVVDAEIALDGTTVSIAHTKAGRIGIAYYVGGFEGGELRLATAVPKAAPYVFTTYTRNLGDFAKAGITSAGTSSGNDTLELLEHDVYDATGDVNLIRIVDGSGPFSDAIPVFLGLAAPTRLAIAADPSNGTLYATALKTTTLDGGVKGDVISARRVGNQQWGPLPPVVQGLTVDQAPGVGPGSLLVDQNGVVHFAYHWCDGFMSSVPRYHTFDGTVWSDRKTIDNNQIDGLSGFSVDLALFGNTKYAAYYFKKSQQTSGAQPTADLRVASWAASLDTPTKEIIDQSIPAPDFTPPSVPPTYRVAIDVDKYGLVHLAIIDPNIEDGTKGVLEYRRQTRDGSGTIKWLSDIVDYDVLATGPNGKALVDLVVDENARPHIAYRSGKSNKVQYATRSDR